MTQRTEDTKAFDPDETQPSPASEPLLVALFDEVREVDSLATPYESEETQTLLASPESIDAARREIDLAWQNVFQLEKFLTALDQPLEGKNQKYLKKVRKFGVMKKFSYMTLSQAHHTPKDFHSFIKKLGQLNDLLEAKVSHSMLMLEVKALALKQNQHGEKASPSVSPAELRRDLVHLMNGIYQSLERDVLPVKEFHDMRKEIRTLMNIFQLEAIHSLGSPAHHVFVGLYELSRDLGHEHDEAVMQDIHGEAKYEEQTQHISPELRERVHKILGIAAEILSRPLPAHV